jgi:hypothetical protein
MANKAHLDLLQHFSAACIQALDVRVIPCIQEAEHLRLWPGAQEDRLPAAWPFKHSPMAIQAFQNECALASRRLPQMY